MSHSVNCKDHSGRMVHQLFDISCISAPNVNEGLSRRLQRCINCLSWRALQESLNPALCTHVRNMSIPQSTAQASRLFLSLWAATSCTCTKSAIWSFRRQLIMRALIRLLTSDLHPLFERGSRISARLNEPCLSRNGGERQPSPRLTSEDPSSHFSPMLPGFLFLALSSLKFKVLFPSTSHSTVYLAAQFVQFHSFRSQTSSSLLVRPKAQPLAPSSLSSTSFL